MLGRELRQAACPAATELAVPVARPGQGYLAPWILALGWAVRVGSTEELNGAPRRCPGGVTVVCVCVPPASPSGLSHTAARKAWKRGIPGAAGGEHRPLSPPGSGSAAGAGRGLRPSPRAPALSPLAAGGPGRPLFTSRRCGKRGGGRAPGRRSPPAAGPGPSLPRGAAPPGAAGPAAAGAGPSVSAAPG